MKSIYISATEPRSGKSTVALGLMNLLKRRADRVGFFKPISNSPSGHSDEDVEMIKRLFRIESGPEFINPLHMDEAGKLLGSGSEDELLTVVLRAYKKVGKNCDVVIIEGTDYVGTLTALELDINANISNTLDAPVLLVANGDGRSAKQITEQVLAAKESFDEKGCDFIGVVVTKIETSLINMKKPILEQEFKKHGIELLGTIPMNETLRRRRAGEIARKMNAKVIYGRRFLSNSVSGCKVAAMNVGHALKRFKDGMLLITPGDREDMILASLASRLATTYPNIAGIVLCGGFEPRNSIIKIIKGLRGINIPILQLPWDTLETAVKISNLPVSLYAEDKEKIDSVFQDIFLHVSREEVYKLLDVRKIPKTTPIVFLNELIERASNNRKRIVLPEGKEERTLKAATKVLAQGIADVILIGKESEILEAVNRSDSKIEHATIIDPSKSDYLEKYTEALFEMRKHKGMTLDHARDIMLDEIYFGTMMVHLGDADGLVSGAIHTTRHTITPAFQIIKNKPDTAVVSSVFFMCLEDKVLVYGDCAVNPNPTPAQLADIAISSAKTSELFGFDPMIAMLSYSTGTSGVGPEVEHVKEATAMVKERLPNLKVEGPIQYDAAISPDTARTKLPESEVAGRANIFIFPDLNSGNTAYKAVQRSAKAIAVGPVLQGLNKPVNDLSRGCSVDDIVYTIAITAIQAQQTK